MLHYPPIVDNMKRYKSYNIETGEPSFPPFRRIFILTAFLFIARPVVYSSVLGLFGVSVGFFLALSVLFTASFSFAPVAAMLLKAFNKIVQKKSLDPRYATVSVSVVTFFASTTIGFLFLKFLGIDASILTVLGAHAAVESLRVL
jgi:hypothetical protein